MCANIKRKEERENKKRKSRKVNKSRCCCWRVVRRVCVWLCLFCFVLFFNLYDARFNVSFVQSSVIWINLLHHSMRPARFTIVLPFDVSWFTVLLLHTSTQVTRISRMWRISSSLTQNYNTFYNQLRQFYTAHKFRIRFLFGKCEISWCWEILCHFGPTTRVQ